jgi:prepilin-type N-terminal cleavage/methylation domain-containing protein
MINKKKAFSLVEISIVIVIIGIIIAAIGNYNNFIGKSYLTNARKATKSSFVSHIPNLALWLDATSNNVFKENNDFLEYISNNQKINWWQDINTQKEFGERFYFTNLNDNQKPVYKLTDLNNLPSLYFDGNDFLQNNSIATYDLASADQMTIFMVQKVDKNSNAINIKSDSPAIYLSSYNNDTLSFTFGSQDSSGIVAKNGYNNNINKTQIITARKKQNVATIFINSKQEAINNSATSTIDSTSIRNLIIGTNFIGYIGEIIIFSRAVSEKERFAVESYLLKKWRIAKNT